MAPSSAPSASKTSWASMISRPSTSKRSGLAATLVASWIATASCSRMRLSPSIRWGSRAARARGCARGARLRCALLGLQSWALVLVLAVGLAVERLLELAHPLPDGAPDLGQLLRAENDQGDGEDDDELERAYVGHVASVPRGRPRHDASLPTRRRSGPTTRRWSPGSRSLRRGACRCRWRGTSNRRRRR